MYWGNRERREERGERREERGERREGDREGGGALYVLPDL